MGVTDFSIGFGKELFGFNDKSGTRWKFCAIPLGGYVKFFGDRNVFSQSEQEELLKKCEITDKIPQFKISEQLKNGNLKIFTDVGDNIIYTFILKISGIWETQYNYGLTYKFIKTN